MTKFEELVLQADNICILGHVNPDGDCLGSTLGTCQYIRNRYPEKTVVVYLQEASCKFAYLPGYDQIVHVPSEGVYDLAVILDCADFERLGEFGELAKRAKEVFVADHHVTNNQRFPHAVVVPEASSTAEVIFDQMDRGYVDQAVATCIYTGIIHDTGVFKYQATSAHTMEIAGFCMGKGIDFSSIIDDGFYMKTYTQQQVMGRALMESMLIMDGRCIFASLRNKDMRFYGVTSKDLDGIVAQLRQTAGVDCAIFLYEVNPQQYKVSLRSNNDGLDVAAVAAYFGGGGHVRAAGCFMHGSVHDAINNITEQLARQMDLPDFVSNRTKLEE